jgi:uncharacterized protein (TIGR03032 family)
MTDAPAAAAKSKTARKPRKPKLSGAQEPELAGPVGAEPGAPADTPPSAELPTAEVEPPPAPAAEPPAPPASTPQAPPPPQPSATESTVNFSRGLHDWLMTNNCALAFSCYQSGHLFMVGRGGAQTINLNGQNFGRTMGIHALGARLYVGTLFQIWRLENALAPHERANQIHDRLYLPRTAQTIGDVDIHEMATDRAGRLVFVNTKFSCLAITSPTRGFTPIWKPTFISKLAAEDRCHLNGLAMENGVVRYVTAVSRSDVTMGWRNRRHEGGVLIDVQADRIVTDQLSMPHSPRVHNGAVWALDSGRGQLIRIDPETGAREDIAFCPGFMRGLAFSGKFAIVTLSLPRGEQAFSGLSLAEEIKKRDGEPWCGLMIIDTSTGDTVEWVKVEGSISELFDVAVLSGVVSPISMSPEAPGLRTLFCYDADFAPLTPPG